MATRKKVLAELNRLEAVFRPRIPKIVNGAMNEAYPGYIEIYINALVPFSDYELEAGITGALEGYKYQTWPVPAELRAYCLEHNSYQRRGGQSREEIMEEVRKQRLEDHRNEVPPEQRAIMAERLGRIKAALKHGHADGTPYGKDEAKDRAWVYQGQATEIRA